MTFYDYVFIVIGWLPLWFQALILMACALLIGMLVIRFIVWIVEIIPGF